VTPAADREGKTELPGGEHPGHHVVGRGTGQHDAGPAPHSAVPQGDAVVVAGARVVHLPGGQAKTQCANGGRDRGILVGHGVSFDAVE
jgi:hypothetical protein